MLKNNEMVAFINGVMDLQKKRLPIKVGYAITKNLNLIKPLAEAYEEQRVGILDRYADKDKNGQFVVVENVYVIKNNDGYDREISELLEIENEIDLHKISFGDLEKCDTEQFDSLSVQDLSLLEIMLDE